MSDIRWIPPRRPLLGNGVSRFYAIYLLLMLAVGAVIAIVGAGVILANGTEPLRGGRTFLIGFVFAAAVAIGLVLGRAPRPALAGTIAVACFAGLVYAVSSNHWLGDSAGGPKAAMASASPLQPLASPVSTPTAPRSEPTLPRPTLLCLPEQFWTCQASGQCFNDQRPETLAAWKIDLAGERYTRCKRNGSECLPWEKVSVTGGGSEFTSNRFHFVVVDADDGWHPETFKIDPIGGKFVAVRVSGVFFDPLSPPAERVADYKHITVLQRVGSCVPSS